MPASLLAPALSAFAVGTIELVIMGLLPQVAGDLRVSIPSAGWPISGHAFAVASGAPLMAMATARPERKKALLALMGIFIAGNLLYTMTANYGLSVLARIVTVLCRGAFFDIGPVVVASLVAPNRRASAVALMLTGLALANVLGVLLGTALDQEAGWRATFWVVILIGAVVLVGLARVLPNDREEEKVDLRQEVSALKNPPLWLALGITALFVALMLALFTHVVPLPGEITGISPRGVTWTLLLIGVGLTVGNAIGGHLADWCLDATMAAVFAVMALVSTLFSWINQTLLPAEITLFFWAIAAFVTVPAPQVNVIRAGHAVPNLVVTLNIGAFNVGSALGAWVGGSVIDHGLGLTRVPLTAVALAALALLATLIAFPGNGCAQAQPVLD